MPKIKVLAKRLVDTDVTTLSLVQRGANRIPFRILKGEDSEMLGVTKSLDLGKLFGLRKSQTVEPMETASVVVSDEAVANDLAESLGGSVSKSEDTFVVSTTTLDENQSSVTVALSEDSSVVLKGHVADHLSEENYVVSAAGERNGVYPSISATLHMMENSIADAVFKSESAEEAVALISKSMNDASEYIGMLVSVAGLSIMKMDKSLGSVIKESNSEVAVEAGVAEPVVEESIAEESVKAEVATDEVAKNDPDSDQPVEGTAVDDDVRSELESLGKEVLSIKDEFASMQTSLKAALTEVLSESLSAVQDSVNSISSRLSEVEKTAEKAVVAVKGTVVAGPAPGDDLLVKSETGKAASPTVGRDIDTAYMPGIRTRNRASF